LARRLRENSFYVTEKAAFEMRDRMAAAARKVGYLGDLSELSVSTIHSLCNRVLTQHRHRTPLGHSFETLDDLTQLLPGSSIVNDPVIRSFPW
jgi:superfamily I DNA/RNA helicase